MRPDLTHPKVTPIEAVRRVPLQAPQDTDDPAYWSAQVGRIGAQHDTDAFMCLFAHFGPRLQRYLTGMGVPPSQAEELVQEAMLRVWRRAAQFDPCRANVSTWLFRIARNLYIDSIRGEPHWLAVQDDLEMLDALPSEDGATSAESFADGRGLDRAIDDLPPQQARMIRMSYFEAKSHSEIARELNQPLGTVKSSLRRAFARLQGTLRKAP
ncbi:sigma-70 family RNA polymerase sigma factor [Luteibacter anthropi]|uniref:RNA polymerase sigma factor n=1 Tax=Luteibacter anthropi TaxID=564369 RepID=A0A7X5UAL7_9GAMM|nr:sigma-70 family RNA polymerase sigma factor [Luteibacter anthropi]URX64719.1 sigma-70 family RNA polymerase sigma factor [Luteibacter anthropi]